MIKNIFHGIILILLVTLAGILGYRIGVKGESTLLDNSQTEPELQLHISVVHDANAGFTSFTPEDLGNNFLAEISYCGLSEVNIEIDGAAYALNTAIRDKIITVDEIITLARNDARNGICKELYQSELGLNRFVYQYRDYELAYTYDVFELPNGEQKLIRDFAVYAPGKHKDISYGLYDEDENGYLINMDREDWGISFEVSDVSPVGLTLHCTQHNGQQLGELNAQYFFLEQIEPNITGQSMDYAEVSIEQALQMDGTTELTLDWFDYYGELSSGKYLIVLYINDVYNQSEIHPLMKNFTDRQRYNIEFNIP